MAVGIRAHVRAFSCSHCGQVVSFDDLGCGRCDSPLGYVPDRSELVAVTHVGDGELVDLTGAEPRRWRRCETSPLTGCNWLVEGDGLCLSCALTRVRPNDQDPEGLGEWVEAERAKRRLLHQLTSLGLPVVSRNEDTQQGLVFDLLSSVATKVITGHDNGIITLDLAEADDEHRERLRRSLNEPYRTLLGHFRHEIGHYYWPILVDDDDTLAACRSLFGDDREDYALAVKQHYERDVVDIPDTHISAYATMHPYEDWAESFAHYLHILDTLETAAQFGLAPPVATFSEVIEAWLRLSVGLNQVNRSMGRDDLYPFVLTPTVVRKLAFVDSVVRR
ncbi:MAG: hypothetical protein JWO22_336 [Frankiales bacterium]|nr:hypothetical protein [Frankiales bacterium]